MEVELFAIRCGINQAVQIPGSSCIIIITDAIHVAQRIFNFSIHLYQLQSITISKNLQEFFNNHLDNSIEFWDCSSKKKWHLHMLVDKEIKEWHTSFKMLNLKRRNFLNSCSVIKLFYMKGGLWIEQFRFSNSLCAQATWAIANHAPIGEYWLRFFLREEFSCLCGFYPIESRCHILYDCRRFNKYWNPMRDTIHQFISFLEFNLNAFSFGESITWVGNLATILVVSFYIDFLFPFFFSFLFPSSPI